MIHFIVFASIAVLGGCATVGPSEPIPVVPSYNIYPPRTTPARQA